MQTNTIQPLVAARWQLQRAQSGTKDKRTRKIFQGLACGRQVIYLLSAFLIAVPNLASSTNYDLRTDWSDAGLPMAGVWTIDFNGTPMIPVPNVEVTGADAFPGGQPGYTTVANDLVPIWFQARDDAVNYFGNPPNADWLLGDIVFHDADAAPTSASWTSPENSLAAISISLWNPRNFNRIQQFELTINGMVLGSGIVDDSSDRANRVSLSVINVPVSVGDIVAVTSTSIVVEDYMGLDFSIVTTSTDRDCSKPRVSFGEVMAGLQAGFTGGTVNNNTLPSGFFLGVSGVDQRGFIDPESGSGWKCDSDWGLVSAWVGITFPTGANTRTRRQAREVAVTVFPVVRIEVNGVEQEVVAPKPKLGILPPQFGADRDAAMASYGAFLEPNSLAPGFHTAQIFFGIDLDCFPLLGNPAGDPPGECDGIVEFEIPVPDPDAGPLVFEVIAD